MSTEPDNIAGEVLVSKEHDLTPDSVILDVQNQRYEILDNAEHYGLDLKTRIKLIADLGKTAMDRVRVEATDKASDAMSQMAAANFEVLNSNRGRSQYLLPVGSEKVSRVTSLNDIDTPDIQLNEGATSTTPPAITHADLFKEVDQEDIQAEYEIASEEP